MKDNYFRARGQGNNGFPDNAAHTGARQQQRRFITLQDPSKVIRVVRQIQKQQLTGLRFFITLTFRKAHFVQNNSYKGLKKVVKFLIETKMARYLLIRRELTEQGDTHFHLACNVFCTVKEIRNIWSHGYVHIGPVRSDAKVVNYLFKNLSINSNELSLVIHTEYTRFMPTDIFDDVN